MPRASSGSSASATASAPLVTPRFAPRLPSVSITASARCWRSRRVIDGRIADATTDTGNTL
jgi:hypothetical protein